jgi:drug/metabolite transporter (DMT)-like permease
MRPRASVYLVLAMGVFAVGWAAIFIRLADAPALSTAAYRLTFAGIPVAGWALSRQRRALGELPRRSWWLLAASGVALAAHFASWIASLELTTVASSVALVTTQPLWVALLTALVLRERVSRGTVVALAVATAGGALIGLGDVSTGGRALAGDALALVGAVCAAVYFAIGRRLRGGLDLAGYIGVVYPVAAVVLIGTALVARQPLSGFSAQTWTMFALLALVPQLIGHSSLNWALKYLPAHLVAVAVLGEPVISILLAIPILGETPGVLQVVGGLVTLCGVYLAVRDEAKGGSQQSAAEGPVLAGMGSPGAPGPTAG